MIRPLIRRLLRRGFFLVALSAAAVVVVVAAAHASPTATAASATPDPGHHCVVTVAPLLPGQAMSVTSAPRCFGTFAEAIAAATNGAVQLPANVQPADVTAATLAPAAPTSTTIIGIDWIDINYSGSSLTWQVSNGVGCTTGLSYQSNVTGSWNNVISSSKAFAGCTLNTHYDLPYPNQNNGAFINCTPNCASMGAMNDATSAESWRP